MLPLNSAVEKTTVIHCAYFSACFVDLHNPQLKLLDVMNLIRARLVQNVAKYMKNLVALKYLNAPIVALKLIEMPMAHGTL